MSSVKKSKSKVLRQKEWPAIVWNCLRSGSSSKLIGMEGMLEKRSLKFMNWSSRTVGSSGFSIKEKISVLKMVGADLFLC